MTALAPGIYQTRNGGYRVVARIGDRKLGHTREKRFPANTALKRMVAWQEDNRAELRREDLRPARDTLAADVERYLLRPSVVALASFKARRSDSKAWLPLMGHLRRHEITADMVRAECKRWLDTGVKAWTVRHRLHALRHLYRTLDGASATNPAAETKGPSKPRTIPRALPYDTIRTTFNQMEPSATKAFLLVVAFCGFRPVEVRRTEPWMLHLDVELPHVLRPTAKGGDVVTVPLSEEGVLAWQMFTDHGGFVKEKGRPRTFPNANRDWKAAMKRAGFTPTRCYDLVHSYCTQLLMAGGGDISLVQKARGHRDIRTTLVYTQVVVDPRLQSAVAQAFRVVGSRGKAVNS